MKIESEILRGTHSGLKSTPPNQLTHLNWPGSIGLDLRVCFCSRSQIRFSLIII